MDPLNKLRIQVSMQHFLLTQLYARTYMSNPDLLVRMREQFALAAAEPIITSTSLQAEPLPEVQDVAVQEINFFFDDVEEEVVNLAQATLQAHQTAPDPDPID